MTENSKGRLIACDPTFAVSQLLFVIETPEPRRNEVEFGMRSAATLCAGMRITEVEKAVESSSTEPLFVACVYQIDRVRIAPSLTRPSVDDLFRRHCEVFFLLHTADALWCCEHYPHKGRGE